MSSLWAAVPSLNTGLRSSKTAAIKRAGVSHWLIGARLLRDAVILMLCTHVFCQLGLFALQSVRVHARFLRRPPLLRAQFRKQSIDLPVKAFGIAVVPQHRASRMGFTSPA